MDADPGRGAGLAASPGHGANDPRPLAPRRRPHPHERHVLRAARILALIITEGTQPSEDGQGYLLTPDVHTDDHVAGWRKVTDAVHQAGGRIVIQLMHVGRVSHPTNTPHGRQPVAPSPVAAGGAMIKVHAVSVNHGPDVETRRSGFGMQTLQMPHIGGVDPAGEIAALGPGTGAFAVGDRVAVYPVIACGVCDFCRAGAGENYCPYSRMFGIQTRGGRAQYVCAPATQLVRLPEAVSYEAAAALGVAYTTTWHGMFECAKVTAADTLLVMGAGGGVGVAAVQLAKWSGARVIAVTGSPSKQKLVRGLGADEVFSYNDDRWPAQVRAATGGRGVTVAFDNSGSATLPLSIGCLGRAGRLFCSGGTTGLDVTLNIRHLYRELISLLFYVQGARADMVKLVELVAKGALEPVIDSRYRLHDAALADERLDANQQFGRIVLLVEHEESEDADKRSTSTDSVDQSGDIS